MYWTLDMSLSAQALTPQGMTDEQLATADELIRETILVTVDHATLMRLYSQQRVLDCEAKMRADMVRKGWRR